MQKLDKIKEVKVAEQSIEVDPRSKTTADQAFNILLQENLKCQLAVRKDVSRKKEILKRTNYVVIGD